ncbi:hypothetical protein PSPO01_15584 [Paraphaeosphaeria sporulosa]
MPLTLTYTGRPWKGDQSAPQENRQHHPDFIDRGTLLDPVRKRLRLPAPRIALVGLGVSVSGSVFLGQHQHLTKAQEVATFHRALPSHCGAVTGEIGVLDTHQQCGPHQAKLLGHRGPNQACWAEGPTNGRIYACPRLAPDEKRRKWLLVRGNADNDTVLSAKRWPKETGGQQRRHS